MPRIQREKTMRNDMLPARVKLKLLVLEADEEQLDRIIQAIQIVLDT